MSDYRYRYIVMIAASEIRRYTALKLTERKHKMLKQARDLLEEGEELHQLLKTMSDTDYEKSTPFKSWTINNVVGHLHVSDKMAVLSLKDPDEFKRVITSGEAGQAMTPRGAGDSLRQQWWEYFSEMCQLLGDSDPKRRVPWFGPDMGVMMFTTARQMETWSHGQDIYDLMGQARVNSDRLENVAVIGVKTYGWTFANRKVDVPGPAPYVKLTAPSGAVWEFNEPNSDNYIEGDAAEFCHVVTQGRNIVDVNLTVVGKPATEWMAVAQCFAGPPENPPAPGTRLINY
ncbi:MAG TPA: TIGR03084 family metal-binding protein [Pseudomonadales bacterium]|jgi:uncharacterized protein (TIGR03084 family)|nr:TIGR03084 family protein [Gammaproteobacteria bacterium]MDP6316550.1 TIGR03084 family metal-binding protein [Pseudomonadales bacterium]HJL60346.1 TIGR03084 family metal-binding protein [Pseudomonadales bacterium]|tara:strand:+ start:768 stop:1628 length:861 start_codon:yes stop_codon:yes gene_type:complete